MQVANMRVLVMCAAGALGLAFATGSAVPGDDLSRALGKALFQRIWVPAPSSTKVNDGLGPLFNARACVQCHAAATAGRLEETRRGTLADRGGVVRLSSSSGAPDPVYGAQVQSRAIQGHVAEGAVRVSWETSQVRLADGTVVGLRRPVVAVSGLPLGAIAADVTASMMLAPSLRVAGQIARVDTRALGDGGTAAGGRVSRGKDGAVLVFGRKASEPDLEAAIATAFARDLGMSTARLPFPAGDCTVTQAACRAAPHGDEGTGVEIAPQIVAALAEYVASLSPRNQASEDAPAAALFAATGCAACHTPSLPGKDGRPVALYSDLRLHDMGPELAGTAEANGQEGSAWRTAGLLDIDARLAAGATLLHDGRARSIVEAVLWHDGAARSAREAYSRLSSDERERLQRYVGSR